MNRAKKRVLIVKHRAETLGFTSKDLQQFQLLQKLFKNQKKSYIKYCLLVLTTLLLGFSIYKIFVSNDQCLLQIPQSWMHLFREPEDCNLCQGIKKIDRVENINIDEFETIYAYTGRPVIVTDGTKNWSPLSTFTFEFFRDLYKDFEDEQNECQFFPYKTEFLSLSDALNMSIDRAHLMEGTKPWYFGWSSCSKAATKLLRQHYTRPYFLPTISESTTLDWIFMGGPGDGAHLHVSRNNSALSEFIFKKSMDELSCIDDVRYPSWQAQLSGRKLWRLVPPPECYFHCYEIEAIVNPGEIIVVDTNRWYHQTFIVSSNVSITIGSEYN